MVIYLNIATIYKGLSFDELKVLKRLFVIVAIYSLLAFPFTPLGGIITAYEKFIHLKLCDFIYKILTVVFVIIALLHDYGVEAVVLASVFSGICAIILKLFIIYKKTPVRYCFTWVDKKLLKSIFTFSVWMTVSSIAQRCVFNIAPSVLAYTSSSKEVALFAPANTLEGYFYMIAAAVNGMFLAKISKLIADSKEHEIVNLMINVGKYQTILMGFILVGFICVGEDFMRLWMGVEYVGSWPCAILLFIPDILLFSQQIANTTAIAQNKVKKISLAYVAMAFVCIALSLVLGKWIGALGSCVAIMLGHIALFIISNVASIVTNALYILGVIDKGGLITAYQNPLNWYLFFWIGRIIRYNLSKILSVVNKLQFMKIVSICLMVVLFSLYYYFVEEPGYWSVFSLLFELISIIVVYLISTNFALRIFKNIGKRSYPIYFIHMQIGMFVGNKILSIIPEINLFPILLVLLKPIMVLLISYYTIMGINKACNRLNLQFILKWFAI